jgi:hypothetical protein
MAIRIQRGVHELELHSWIERPVDGSAQSGWERVRIHDPDEALAFASSVAREHGSCLFDRVGMGGVLGHELGGGGEWGVDPRLRAAARQIISGELVVLRRPWPIMASTAVELVELEHEPAELEDIIDDDLWVFHDVEDEPLWIVVSETEHEPPPLIVSERAPEGLPEVETEAEEEPVMRIRVELETVSPSSDAVAG